MQYTCLLIDELSDHIYGGGGALTVCACTKTLISVTTKSLVYTKLLNSKIRLPLMWYRSLTA